MKDLYFGCVCITYNRPHVLPEIIESFLRQTYKNAELVILDDADQYPSQEGERWKLVSVKERFATLCQKRDYVIRHLFSEKVNAIATFDDDDVPLSNYLLVLAENLQKGFDVVTPSGQSLLVEKGKFAYEFPLQCFLQQGWLLHRGAYLLDAYLSSGGYPRHIHYTDDVELMAAFVRARKNIHFFYGKSYYLNYLSRVHSSYGHISRHEEPSTDIVRFQKKMIPHWKEEYEQLCRKTISETMPILEDVHFMPEKVGFGYPYFGQYLGYSGFMVEPPSFLKNHQFFSIHAPSIVKIQNQIPLKVIGFLNQTAKRKNGTPVEFRIDNLSLGEIHHPGEVSQEISLLPGEHHLTIDVKGDHSGCHTVWAFR